MGGAKREIKHMYTTCCLLQLSKREIKHTSCCLRRLPKWAGPSERSNTRHVAYSNCLSGRGSLAKSERSISTWAAKPLHMPRLHSQTFCWSEEYETKQKALWKLRMVVLLTFMQRKYFCASYISYSGCTRVGLLFANEDKKIKKIFF